MEKISRHDIYTACNCSENVDQTTVQKALMQKVYADKSSWSKFLKLLFLSLGLGFTAIGIVFFLAYNWQELNKFVKLGIVQLLICIGVILVLQNKSSPFFNAGGLHEFKI